MNTSFVDQLIDKGMNRDDLAFVGKAMVSHYNRVNEVHTKIAACRECSLRKGCHQVVTGTGELQPEIVVVSDTPDESEDKFGMSGFSQYAIYLMGVLQKVGVHWDQVFWTHAVKCRTDKIKMININDCHVNLVNQLARLRPTAIIALGTTAISSLAGEPVKINDAIGEEFFFELGSESIPVIPIKHPRNIVDLDKDDFKEETKMVWRALKPLGDLIDSTRL